MFPPCLYIIPRVETQVLPTKVHARAQDDSSYERIRYVYTLRAVSNKPRRTKLPRTIAKVNSTETEFIIDTGAASSTRNGFNNLRDKPKLDRTDIRVRAYKSKQPITILGKFCAKQVHERETQATFYVTDGHDGSLLTCETTEALKLVTVDRKFLLAIDAKGEPDPLYEGVRLLKDFSVKLHIDDSVPPVAKPHRRIPTNLREKVEEKLRQLEKDDIEKVDGPTPWVSQPVFPPK